MYTYTYVYTYTYRHIHIYPNLEACLLLQAELREDDGQGGPLGVGGDLGEFSCFQSLVYFDV